MIGNHGINIKRRRLWQTDPHCVWCGVVTRLDRVPAKYDPRQKDIATVDHLRGKLPGEASFIERGVRVVLACWECNWKRSRLEYMTATERARTLKYRLNSPQRLTYNLAGRLPAGDEGAAP